jgi:hypothetical protein
MIRTAVTGSVLAALLAAAVPPAGATAAVAPAAVDPAVAAAAAPAAARAAHDDLPRLDERTALMLGARRLKLGILSFDYGLTERISVGTDPPPWAARVFLPVLVPNLHLKISVLQRGPVSLALRGAGYYVVLKDQGSASGSLVAVPLSLFASFRLQERSWLHSELTYNYVRAFGTGALDQSGLGGRVATQAVQVGAMFEWRLTRIFSLTARGRYQVYTGPLAFQGSATLDPYTTINVDGTAEPRVEHPWQAVGGVAFLWRHFHLILGAGYGYYFVPGMEIPYPKLGFVPDASLSFLL